ncbi:unnamed protein product [Boreogadus saida]
MSRVGESPGQKVLVQRQFSSGLLRNVLITPSLSDPPTARDRGEITHEASSAPHQHRLVIPTSQLTFLVDTAIKQRRNLNGIGDAVD